MSRNGHCIPYIFEYSGEVISVKALSRPSNHDSLDSHLAHPSKPGHM